jgi:hypothetical protein
MQSVGHVRGSREDTHQHTDGEALAHVCHALPALQGRKRVS